MLDASDLLGRPLPHLYGDTRGGLGVHGGDALVEGQEGSPGATA